MIEDANALIIIDLQEPLFRAFYFAHHAGRMPSKTLLFPLRFKMKNPVGSQSALDRLNHFGFKVRFEKNEIILLQQPALLEQVNTTQIEGLVKAAGESEAALCEALGKFPLQGCDFDSAFLMQWLETKPPRVLRLSDEMIDKMLCRVPSFYETPSI